MKQNLDYTTVSGLVKKRLYRQVHLCYADIDMFGNRDTPARSQETEFQK